MKMKIGNIINDLWLAKVENISINGNSVIIRFDADSLQFGVVIPLQKYESFVRQVSNCTPRNFVGTSVLAKVDVTVDCKPLFYDSGLHEINIDTLEDDSRVSEYSPNHWGINK